MLRKQPPGKLLPSAHAVDREYRVIKALAGRIPVPKVFYLCEDRELIDGMFFIMSYMDGRTFWNAALPELDSAARGQAYEQMASILATLHDVDLQDAGLEDSEAVAKTGRRFRDTVLALGGSQHPMDVFVAFRGREPETAALLRHSFPPAS